MNAPRSWLPGFIHSLILAALVPWAVIGASLPEITVEAGSYPRQSTLVHFPAPSGLSTNRSWQLRAADGSTRPLQLTDGEAWFVETNLPALTSRTYRIERAGRASRRESYRPSARWVGQDVELSLGGHAVLRYLAHEGRLPRTNIAEVYRRGGYLHPVCTPSGRIVTDDYALNHIHHHGIWAAWTKTRFEGRTPDFWNMGEGKGRVDFARFDDLQVGAVFARLEARQVFTDTLAAPPVQVLEDAWAVTVYPVRLPAGPPIHVFDLRSEQRLLTPHPLELPKYFYGGMGFRGPWNWNGASSMSYLDSNGVTNRVAANGTQVRWYWVGGTVDGSLAGIAVLGHPDNYRSPQPVRVHPTEPFLCWAPSNLGDWSLQPGTPYLSQYRFVAFDGPANPDLLERLWADFAEPPLVRVSSGPDARPGRP